MADYLLETQEYNGLQVTSSEKAFLEIFASKILKPKMHRANIRSEENRLMQETNVRRYGELAQATAIRPALVENIVAPKTSAPSSASAANVSIGMVVDHEEKEDSTNMDVDEVEELTVPVSSEGRKIGKKIKNDLDDDEEDQITYFFPQEGVVGNPRGWSAATAVNTASYPLPGFSFKGKNAIKIKVVVPEDSKGWAFNITPLSDIFNTNIYFHFNPRNKKKVKKICMNHKCGTWGDQLQIPAGEPHEENDIKASHMVLEVFIHEDGFLVFANDIFTAFFPHRNTDLPIESDLQIVFPRTDANGKKYDVRVDQVWWGHNENLGNIITSNIRLLMDAAIDIRKTLPNMVSPMVPRTVIIRNMPITEDLYDLQDIEFMITDKLEKDLGQEVMKGISISLVQGASFGYARFENPAIAEQAAHLISTIEIDDDTKGMTFKFMATSVLPVEIGHEGEVDTSSSI